MKHLAIILCAASALLGGCAAEAEYWYQRKANAPDFDVVKAKCRVEALTATSRIDCTVECREPTPPVIDPETQGAFSAGVLRGQYSAAVGSARRRCNECLSEKSETGEALGVACMKRMGWSPCDESNLHVPQCQ